MKEHLHAEFLRAIADGESLDGWEIAFGGQGWIPTSMGIAAIFSRPNEFAVRRKQKMLSINGHEFPEPMQVAPKNGESYWLANPADIAPNKQVWNSDDLDKMWLSSGLCHSTREAAEAHHRAIILASVGTL